MKNTCMTLFSHGIRDGIPMDVGGRKACLHLSLVEVMLDTKAARRGSKTVEVAERIPARTSPETIQA